jgi:hypothetical protein
MVCVCTVVVSLVCISPADAQTNAVTVRILDPQPNTKIGSDLDVTVAVDLGGSESGTLLIELGPASSAIDIPAGTCDGGCTKTTRLSVPNGDWDNPVEPGPIYLQATASVPDAEPATQVYGLTLDGPSPITGFAVVRNGVEHRTTPVLEGAASVLLEANDRQHSDDVAEMRLVGGALWTPVATGEAPWIAAGATYTAEIPFDVSSIPDGDYLLGVRSRTATGRWGHSYYEMWVRVSHVDTVSMTASSPPYLVVGDAAVAVNVTVRGAIPGNLAPGALRVSLDGVDHDLTSPAWIGYDWSRPNTAQTLQFLIQRGELASGTHHVTFQLLTSLGQPLGAALSRTYTVSDFSGTLSVPKVQVVGQRLSGVATAVAPTGYKLTDCSAGQTVLGTGQEFGSWCSSALAKLGASFTFTPQAAGVGAAVLTVQAAGQTRQHSQSVTVYAARRVSVTAPALPYGSQGTARITVQDAKVLNQWQAAPSGVRVTLQRLTAGTSTWLTVGSAYTAPGGTASVPFTSFANGRFRVLATSSVPGQTITSPTIAAVSLAAVSWRRAPTSALRGKTYIYEAATKPYEPGVKAYLQVRPPGVQSWAGARTISLPSTGIARFSYAFSRTGYWRVRVFRGSTALRTGVPSSVVGVWVR